MQRNFIIGDKWVYYKIYCGYKTSDMILTEFIGPISNGLIDKGLIDKWFFIRYNDPKFHIRWRLHTNTNKNIGNIIESIFHMANSYLTTGQIHDIKIDTYKRELERYGSKSMELSENIFCFDSQMIANVISLLDGNEGEKIRWLFSMRAIDQLLIDFKYHIESRFELLTLLANNFGNEFNLDSQLIIQLSNKYRKEKKGIFEFMNRNNDHSSEYLPLFNLLKNKSNTSIKSIKELIHLNDTNNLEVNMNDLLSSYIHMLMNRLFRSNQRLHELVIYGFLFRYYRSEIARKKYSKNNV